MVPLESVQQLRSARGGFARTGTLAVFAGRTILPGAAGSALIAAGALGVGWLPAAGSPLGLVGTQLLRSTTTGLVSAGLMVAVGVLLLLHTWLVLGSDLRSGFAPEPRWLGIALGAWCAPLLFAPPMFSRDVYSYVAQGRVSEAGLDPYVQGPSSLPGAGAAGVDPMWSDTPSPYGQLFVLLGERVAEVVGPNTFIGAVLFRLLALAGVLVLLWAVPVLAIAYGVDPARAIWLGVLNPLVPIHFVAGAHNDAMMIGLIAAGFAVILRGRPGWGVLLVALGGAIKPIGLLALPFAAVIWAGRGASVALVLRRTVAAGVMGVAVIVGLAALTGTGLGWLQSLDTPGQVHTWLSPPTAIGLAMGAAFDAGGLDLTEELVTTARAVGLIIGVLAIAWLCLRPTTRTPVRSAAIGFLILIACAPAVQPWYALWVLPLLAVSNLTRLQQRLVIWATVGLVLFSLASHFNDGRVFA